MSELRRMLPIFQRQVRKGAAFGSSLSGCMTLAMEASATARKTTVASSATSEYCVARFTLGSVLIRQGAGSFAPGEPAENGVIAESVSAAAPASEPQNNARAIKQALHPTAVLIKNREVPASANSIFAEPACAQASAKKNPRGVRGAFFHANYRWIKG